MPIVARYSQQLIASLALKLQEIDDKRRSLFAQIADLDIAWRAVHAEYSSTVNEAAAIAILPDEILASIFEEAHSSEQSIEMCISQVSHRWREVATNTPKLWTDIHVEAEHRKLEMATLYLKRSKAVPFDITVCIPWYRPDIETLERLFAEHISRCHRLTIVLETNADNGIFHFLQNASAPLLKHIKVSCSQGTREQILWFTGPTPIFTSGAPMLQTLRISSFPWLLPTLESVTALSLCDIHPNSYLSPENLRSTLLALRSLAILEVNGEIAAAWSSAEAVELPALRTLKLAAGDLQNRADQFEGLYHAIDAPSLEHLSLRNFTDDEISFLSNIFPSRQKFPTLHALTLINADENAISSNLRSLMDAFAHVET
ncbi:hypothetical protein HWV62_41958, partial [Athelia sp. TMB]